MESQFSVPVNYCRVIMAASGRNMADAKRLVEGTDINKQTLDKLESGVTQQDYRRLLQNAKTVSGNPTILLDAGANAPISSHGALGHAISCSPDRMAVLNLMVRFVKSRATFFTVSLKQSASTVRFHIDTDPALGQDKDDALEFMLGTLLCTLMSRELLPMPSLRLQLMRRRPEQHEHYQRVLGCHISYNQPVDCVLFDVNDLKMPLPGYDSGQFEMAVRKCQRMFSKQFKSSSTREAVENIFDLSPGMLWSVQHVAKGLATSSRTLQRRLKNEGTNYQAVLDNWLQKQAEQFLVFDGLSVESTATLLGYGDEANFRRAFKRWFGYSPQEYRQRCSEQRQDESLVYSE